MRARNSLRTSSADFSASGGFGDGDGRSVTTASGLPLGAMGKCKVAAIRESGQEASSMKWRAYSPRTPAGVSLAVQFQRKVNILRGNYGNRIM
jgi:hypothetical protein